MTYREQLSKIQLDLIEKAAEVTEKITAEEEMQNNDIMAATVCNLMGATKYIEDILKGR